MTAQIPVDMIDTPPEPCDFKVGDKVVYTNDYGVTFNLVVRGFASKPHGIRASRFVYVFKDAWWFPVDPSSLAHDHSVRVE